MSPQVAAEARVIGRQRADGSWLLRVAEPLGEHPPTLADALLDWAARSPDAVLAAERDGDGWRSLTYGEAASAAAALGQAYLDRGLGPGRPVLLLSGNSLDHLLLTLAGYLTGVPVVPVSAAYSLRSTDHGRLRAIAGLVRPGLVFAEDGERFRAALDAVTAGPAATTTGSAVGSGPTTVVSGRPGPADLTVAALRATAATPDVERARRALTPDSVAKILFTSGSTGTPKGVLNTHRMLCANQQMIRQIWPFVDTEPPVLTDWLPWSHTFGGNHNLHLALCNGGTLYIDDGSPLPGGFERTVEALRQVPPTVCVNVPAGYALLAQRLENDPPLAERVLSRARLLVYAGADLPDALRERLRALARKATGREVELVSSWGATETGPAATSTYGGVGDGIGIPLPGVELKLVPVGGCFELRVRGASLTPGCLGADLGGTLDEEGYYRTGDAARPLDPGGDPRHGLRFDGRTAENFKIANGTWVLAGRLRNALLSAAGVLSDVVLIGDGRPQVAAIGWLALGRANDLLGTRAADPAELLGHEGLRRHLAGALARLNAGAGAASRVERLVLVAEPPSLEAGELTDKGYLNQRVVVEQRGDVVELLYAEEPEPGRVIVAGC
ncbi:AMP-binding protein [Kitasatospora aureofaciens]|uniref:AMP-binding protein n=1 Tax=Kitasatospora aureofaciens TaxID=1894 RepID=UPI0005267F94|nr:AMP-binding protein [Kitasatospora aureofaciens]HJD85322.1 AMP-binding protein [Kitasatospora aureofaciens]